MNFIQCFFARRKYVKTPEFNQILSDCYDIIDQQKILIAQSRGLSSKYCTANPHIGISVSLSVLKNLDKDLIKKITKYVTEDEFDNLLELQEFNALYEKEYKKLKAQWEGLERELNTYINKVDPELFPLGKFYKKYLAEREAEQHHLYYRSYSTPNLYFYYCSPAGRSFYDKTIILTKNKIKDIQEYFAFLKTPEEIRRKERQKTASFRDAVLKRDKYTCQHCGFKADKDHLALLHVDHIKPIAKGGKTTMDNLQTLCASCNLKKGDKYNE